MMIMTGPNYIILKTSSFIGINGDWASSRARMIFDPCVASFASSKRYRIISEKLIHLSMETSSCVACRTLFTQCRGLYCIF